MKESINCKVWAKVHVGCESGKMISQLIASLWYGDRTIKEILWPAQWQMRIRVPCLFVSTVINGSKVEQLKKREKNERRIPRPSLLKHHPAIHSFIYCHANPTHSHQKWQRKWTKEQQNNPCTMIIICPTCRAIKINQVPMEDCRCCHRAHPARVGSQL